MGYVAPVVSILSSVEVLGRKALVWCLPNACLHRGGTLLPPNFSHQPIEIAHSNRFLACAFTWPGLPTLIGHARVSTGGQSVQRQVDELHKAGCAEILEETASGADRNRPVLAALLRRIRRGETLVVVKFDRLARSLEHLLEVVRILEARGAYLRVLGDPIDTTTPQGRFISQNEG
jgi:Resolvase, N terminal domain